MDEGKLPKPAEENIFVIRKRRHLNSRKPEKVEEDAEKEVNPMEIADESKSKKNEKDSSSKIQLQKSTKRNHSMQMKQYKSMTFENEEGRNIFSAFEAKKMPAPNTQAHNSIAEIEEDKKSGLSKSVQFAPGKMASMRYNDRSPS